MGRFKRTKATAHGGMGVVAKVIAESGLASEIDESLSLLKVHKPDHESDHVLNIGDNVFCGGGSAWASIEPPPAGVRPWYWAWGPKPAGPRPPPGISANGLHADAVTALQEGDQPAACWNWRRPAASESSSPEPAVIDADASIVCTDGQTKQGIPIA